MNKDIIIVGNGSSLLDGEFGKLIDSFKTVVRFNSFKIRGYEKHVGSKTDVWFTVNRKHISDIHKFKDVICHSWEPSEEKCKLFQDLKSVRKSTTKISKDIYKEIPLEYPSSGIIAIFFFLQHFKSVSIIGFDWWSREIHHYADNEVRGKIHEPNKEFDILNDLNKENKLFFA